jgi:hypothetical protein
MYRILNHIGDTAMQAAKPKSTKSFSLDLASNKISQDAPGAREYLQAVSGSDADRLIALWRDLQETKAQNERLAQAASAGGEFMQHLSADEQTAVRASFFTAAGIDSRKLAAALLAVASRENAQVEKKGELGTVQKRLADVASAIMAQNNSYTAEKWYMREMINSKSLTVAAGVNIPAAQEFIEANKAAIEAHNAGLRGGEPVGDYFNRQAKKAAKENEIFNIPRIRARQNEAKQWVIVTEMENL